jgi:hypothetical protein
VLRGIHARVSQLRVTSLSDPSRSEVSIREIHRIVDAIRARDEEGAWNACHDHVMRASDAALSVLRKQQRVEIDALTRTAAGAYQPSGNKPQEFPCSRCHSLFF